MFAFAVGVISYTEAAAAYKRKTYRGSVADMPVPEEKQTMFLPGIMEEEEEPRNTPRTSSASLVTYPDSPMTEKRSAGPLKQLHRWLVTLVKRFFS